MLLVMSGYVFGIIHKLLYNFTWVIWAYVALLSLVGVDVVLYAINRQREKKENGR